MNPVKFLEDVPLKRQVPNPCQEKDRKVNSCFCLCLDKVCKLQLFPTLLPVLDTERTHFYLTFLAANAFCVLKKMVLLFSGVILSLNSTWVAVSNLKS